MLERWYFIRIRWKASFSYCWGKKAHICQDTKASPHSIYKYRAYSEQQSRMRTVTEATIILVTGHMRSLGQVTYARCTLAIPVQYRDNTASSLQKKCWRHKNS